MKKPTRFFSSRQEREVAKAVNGKQTANSGATAFQKGDVMSANWLFECKTVVTPQKTFSVKKEWLEKNEEEAFAMGKAHNALVFDFGDFGKRYYVIDEQTFKKMLKALEEAENEDSG